MLHLRSGLVPAVLCIGLALCLTSPGSCHEQRGTFDDGKGVSDLTAELAPVYQWFPAGDMISIGSVHSVLLAAHGLEQASIGANLSLSWGDEEIALDSIELEIEGGGSAFERRFQYGVIEPLVGPNVLKATTAAGTGPLSLTIAEDEHTINGVI
jgi:hypothetical protein